MGERFDPPLDFIFEGLEEPDGHLNLV